jgi:1-phosphofructokinase
MGKAPHFFCLCMSPAIDATVRLPSPIIGGGEIFKDVADDENVGGKTVNVARHLALRGAEVSCGGLLGEENDAAFAKELAEYGIADAFLRVPGSTRRNEMIVWPGGSVKLNRAAFPALDWNGELCGNVLAAGRIKAGAVAVVSGSLPPSVPGGFYREAIESLKKSGCFTVLDASREALAKGLEAKPDLIKPNAEECEAVVGFVPSAPEDFRRATKMLAEKSRHVIISDGAKGAWFDGEFFPAPAVEVVDTTAAGDTLLAEYCYRRWAAGEEPAEAAKWAVAAGSAACTTNGGSPPPMELIRELKESNETL